jgi:hypothetical protein
MFRRHEKYRHRNCLDIDIVVLNRQYQGREYFKLKVKYVAQRNEDFIFEYDTIRIYRKDFKHWILRN